MTDSFDLGAMRKRLAAHIEQTGMSLRAVSLKSGHGPGYVHSILNDGKQPGVESLAKVCDACGASLPYIMYGYDIPADLEPFLRLLQENPQKRQHLLALLAG